MGFRKEANLAYGLTIKMAKDQFKRKVEQLLSFADVRINGRREWDITVHNDLFYQRVLSKGSIGLGESYMDGWWDCKALDKFFERVLRAELDRNVVSLPLILNFIGSKVFNLQKKSRAFIIGERHYDIGNNLYKSMLDKGMNYSCGYWKNAKNLNEAQEAKLDLICRKLKLKKGMKVLDIGCGWGGFAKYAAEKYKVNVVGITVSKQQLEFGKKLCRGLPVQLRLQDYRSLNEKFDAIVSIGMFEHVGYKNYRTFMKVVYKC